MAELDVQLLTEAKAAVGARLAQVKLRRYHLRAVDRRLETYCRAVIDNPDKHNLWEQLAVERFLHLCERYGLDVDAVQTYFRFYEALSLPSPEGPRSYKLTPVQAFQFASIYGFQVNGARLVREACLFVPRKFSKTTSSAAFAVWDLLLGDANAESYVGANSADQAKKCFDTIRGAVIALDPEERYFVVNEQTIRSNIRGHDSKAQCLTSNARTKDGLNASTVVMDEYSQARDSNLLTVLTTSQGARREPLTVIITTASSVYEGPFYTMLQGYKRLLLGEFEDDTTFVHLFEPDVGDDEGDPATWRKVHPHLGVTVREDFYAREWAKAQREGGDALMAFRTKLLNQYFTNAGRDWLSRDDIDRCSRHATLEELRQPGNFAVVGVDFSRCNDLTASCAAYYNPHTCRTHLVVDYFFPEGAVEGHTDEELLRKWAAEGHLHLTDGPTVQFGDVARCINDVAAIVPVMQLGYDSYAATDFANHMRAIGYAPVIMAIPQGYGYFGGPVAWLERFVKEGTITIDDNPINRWCFGNCIICENSMGCKPEKKSPALKIDGVIAMLMAIRCLVHLKR